MRLCLNLCIKVCLTHFNSSLIYLHHNQNSGLINVVRKYVSLRTPKHCLCTRKFFKIYTRSYGLSSTLSQGLIVWHTLSLR